MFAIKKKGNILWYTVKNTKESKTLLDKKIYTMLFLLNK